MMKRNQESLIRPVMPELDTVRGLAILLVLFFHGFGFQFASAPLPRLAHLFVVATMPGWVGVNLFFVLSRFLITGLLLDSNVQPHERHLLYLHWRSFLFVRCFAQLPSCEAINMEQATHGLWPMDWPSVR